MSGIILGGFCRREVLVSKLKLQEDGASSCRAIAHFIRELHFPTEYVEGRNLVLRDLCSRVAAIDNLERAVILANAFQSILPETIRKTFGRTQLRLEELRTLRREKKERKDVGIVTILGEELRAVLAALGRPQDAPPDEKSGEFSYWIANIPQGGREPITCVIMLVGEARNVPCAIAVEHLLNDYTLSSLILVGIAAGPEGVVRLGDVVYADQVYDYEEYRLEVATIWKMATPFRIKRPRPKIISTTKQTKLALERLEYRKFVALFAESIRQVPPDLLPPQYSDFQVPKLHDGTIAAGEKLIADGSLKHMRRRVDERIRAGDMEDSGFAQVADFKKIPWCIFRGISDYGDPRKKNGWQFLAGFAAACAALAFLKSTWDVRPAPDLD